jgi:hypothetical protein
MKIAYVVHWDVSRESGVLKKISRHIKAWVKEGDEVKLFAFSSGQGMWQEMADIPVEIVPARRLRNAILKSRMLFERVSSWKPELIYFRFNTYYPGMSRLMASFPTVLEVNTNILTEMKASAPFYLYWYHRCLCRNALRNAAGFAFLTEETSSNYSQYKKPFVVIGDSIDFKEFPESPAPRNPIPRIIFMTSGTAEWHGLDKILWLSEQCRDWHFDLIGVDAPSVSRLAGENVSAHGFLRHEQYDSLMMTADIAVGTMALHRIGMNQTAPLKVREYLAYGLPTIIGYHDTDFPQPVDFLLELPNTERNVVSHLEEIEHFVKKWSGKRVPRAGVSHLDVGVKEKRRLAFFNEILQS